ncbi:MAG: YraN family protein [Proteobacteria bacterium]|nr:YraN family protein [Pseudomonadota bacterium]
MQTRNSYKAGLAAELLSALWLTLKGYRILGWRFKTSVGEIDIIAKRGKVLAFVEVKSRPSLEEGFTAISPENASRVRRAAEWWMKSNPGIADKCDIRFDAVALANYSRIKHLPNAF